LHCTTVALRHPRCGVIRQSGLQLRRCVPTPRVPTPRALTLPSACSATCQALKICDQDVVLTLTSGGCNALNLLLHGASHVVSVDCNPAQSALLELKVASIKCGLCRLRTNCHHSLFRGVMLGAGGQPLVEHGAKGCGRPSWTPCRQLPHCCFLVLPRGTGGRLWALYVCLNGSCAHPAAAQAAGV
jgi:Protein of unknown function (DUF3419)